jgi:predicted DNA-binding transcriptional regulator AlpA
MTSLKTTDKSPLQEPHSILPIVLTPKEAAQRLKLSTSFLAKARMRGDGPPYILIGRAVRYSQSALLQWLKSCQRLSTSEH